MDKEGILGKESEITEIINNGDLIEPKTKTPVSREEGRVMAPKDLDADVRCR